MARRFVYFACLVGFVVVGTAPAAHAYIDPAGGGFLLQMILGGIFGFAAVIATFWQRVKSFLRRLVGRGSKDDSPDPAETQAQAAEPEAARPSQTEGI
jgi:hypothetical protein